MIARMQEDVEFIQKLSDYPTMDDGLDAEEIKKRFDAGSVAIKTFINESLIPETEQEIAEVVERVNSSEESIKEHKETLEQLANSLKELAEAGRIQLFRLGYTTETDTYFLGGTSYAELKALHDDRKHIALQHDFLGVPECFHCSGMTTLNGVTGLAFHFCFKATSKWAFVGSDGSIQVGFVTNESGGEEVTASDIYQQLLTGYDRANAQLRELLAVRNDMGETVFSFENENLTGTIRTNGVIGLIECEITDLTLEPKNGITFDNLIEPKLNPFLSHVIFLFNENGTAVEGVSAELSSYLDLDEGTSRLRIYNETDEPVTITGWRAVQQYDLAYPSIAEGADLRIGYDGTTYPTAGEAVREQARYAIENSGKVKLFRFTGSPGGVCSLVNTNYAELKALYDDQKHIALYYRFSGIGDRYYHCSGVSTLNGVVGLAFQFCFSEKSEWVFVGEDDSVQMGTVSSSGVALDDTLTQSGKAADAKAVGDKLGDIETALDSIIEIQNGIIGGGTE